MREYEPTTEDMREHYVELVEQAGGHGWWAGKRWDDWLDYTFYAPEKALDEARTEIEDLKDKIYDLKQDIDDLEMENERLVNGIADAETA